MSEWLSDAVIRGESVTDWLSPKRHASLNLLRQAKWPTRKTEAWKYTPLKALENIHLAPAANSEMPAIKTAHGAAAIEDLDSIDLFFVDGELQATHGLNRSKDNARK